MKVLKHLLICFFITVMFLAENVNAEGLVNTVPLAIDSVAGIGDLEEASFEAIQDLESEEEFTEEEQEILDGRIAKRAAGSKRRIKRRGANIAISGPEQLIQRKVARRKKGAFAIDLNNKVAYMKLSRKRGDFSGPLRFMPENFLTENEDGSRSLTIVDDEGNEVVIAARGGNPVFLKDGAQQSFTGAVGEKGDTGPQGLSGNAGSPGSVGPTGPAGATGPAGGVFGTTGIITSNESGAPVSYTSNDFVFGSPSLIDDGDASHDRRMFFDKSSGAFGAGFADFTQWNSPGAASAVFGFNNTAAAANSVAFGTTNTITAAGTNSFVAGETNNVSGQNSFAAGQSNNVAGFASAAFGFTNNVSQGSSMAAGRNNIVSGSESVALGESNTASGASSFALGQNTEASASGAVALGIGVSGALKMTNATANSLGIGFNSTVPSFFVGPASGVGTVGNVGVGNSNPQRNLHVSDTVRIEPRASAPAIPAQGDIYVDSTNGAFCFFDGAVWQVAAGTGPCV